MNNPLISSGRHLSSLDFAPKKQQWALINDFQAEQFMREKKQNKLSKYERVRSFRENLDHQVQEKNLGKQQIKEHQNLYYEQILEKDQQLKQKQDQAKKIKLNQYRNIAQENHQLMNYYKNLKTKNKSHFEESFEIGQKSQLERKERQKKAKKQLVDSLDQQVKLKAEQIEREKKEKKELEEENIRYQFEDHKRQKKIKRYGQNETVIKCMKNAMEEKAQKTRDVEEKLIQAAREKKRLDEQKKLALKQQQKRKQKAQMKMILDQQVERKWQQRSEQRKTNPQQHSYEMFGHLFREKTSPLKKENYRQELNQQVLLKKKEKQRQRYMNEQQYRLNLNQLNRVISGEYAHNRYIDRSVTSIGAGKSIGKDKSSIIGNEDRQTLKMNISHLKQVEEKEKREEVATVSQGPSKFF